MITKITKNPYIDISLKALKDISKICRHMDGIVTNGHFYPTIGRPFILRNQDTITRVKVSETETEWHLNFHGNWTYEDMGRYARNIHLVRMIDGEFALLDVSELTQLSER